MVKKAKTVFVCQDCGNESPKWMGQCICGAWNTMVEEVVVAPSGNDKRSISKSETGAKPQLLSQVVGGDQGKRLDTGIGELNRVLGGGIVQGSLTLISGEPGIGKSTIIMQAAWNIAKSGKKVLYVSGEESEAQIKLRADRICGQLPDNLYVMSETHMETIGAAIENLKPGFLIIDSIQTMYTDSMESAPGSVSQIRGCGNELMKLGKMGGIPIFIVAHVTKTGELAGPKVVEHLVDCVLHFTGERNAELRILRAFKNRFGTTSEVGAFEMAGQGLLEIEDLSKRFLENMGASAEGSVITAVYEGTRPLLMELQALVAPTALNYPRRTAIGTDLSRLNMILAVMERKVGISFVTRDVYVNIVGGVRPEGTSTDLAIALAIYSSLNSVTAETGLLALGEIGLTGELRSVPNIEKIIREATRMGFKKIILPASQAEKLTAKGENQDLAKGIQLIGVANLWKGIEACFPPRFADL